MPSLTVQFIAALGWQIHNSGHTNSSAGVATLIQTDLLQNPSFKLCGSNTYRDSVLPGRLLSIWFIWNRRSYILYNVYCPCSSQYAPIGGQRFNAQKYYISNILRPATENRAMETQYANSPRQLPSNASIIIMGDFNFTEDPIMDRINTTRCDPNTSTYGLTCFLTCMIFIDTFIKGKNNTRGTKKEDNQPAESTEHTSTKRQFAR